MQVKVKVTDLLEVLKKNRDKHRASYEDVMSGWRKKVAYAARNLVEQAESGKLSKKNHQIGRLLGDCPEGHLGDYDSAIGMLEMTVEESIDLEQEEYRTYVMDEWHWKDRWTTSSSSYSSTSASSS